MLNPVLVLLLLDIEPIMFFKSKKATNVLQIIGSSIHELRLISRITEYESQAYDGSCERRSMVEPAFEYVTWGESREIALIRDNRRCRICGIETNLHAHHLIPRHLGGSDAAENLITLCAACHATHHPTLQVSLSRSFIEKWALRLALILDFSNEIPEDMERVKVALRLLGKDHFREGQLEVVLAALRKESILVVRPTGSGKSLCYQVPALMNNGISYVFSPLKALMVDQSIGLHQNMIPATFINSDLTLKEKQARYELLEKRALKFLFLTPERFDPSKVKNGNEIDMLKQIRPGYLVVDEAHCVDRWGNDFRPSYGRLAEVRTQLGNPPILAFTATAGVKAQKRILESMGIPDAKVFVSDVDRPNIALIRHEPKSIDEKFKIIKKLIGNNYDKAMIFVPTVKIGDEVSRGLIDMGIPIPFYHGQMNAVDREFLLGQFTGRLKPEIDNIICTNAFGMGIDLPNVHLVIHWMQSESVEDYLQEFGRAGRDGKPSIALIFKSRNDTDLRFYMARMTAQEATRKGMNGQASLSAKIENINKLDSMILNRRQCFRKQIMDYFKEDGEKKRKPIAMRILEWILSKKNITEKSSVCCDACDAKKIQRWLADDRDIQCGERKVDRMNFSKNELRKWKWRPKRWWIFLIVFWLFSTAGADLFGIILETSEQQVLIMRLTLLVAVFAAITDREYSIPKRIIWLLLVVPCYQGISLLLTIIVGEVLAAVLTSSIVVILVIRQSKFFVEPAIDIKIAEQQKKETEISTSAG